MKKIIEGSELIPFGFVHVTGLTVREQVLAGGTKTIVATDKVFGTRGINNQYEVVVTEHGKVWLAYGRPEDRETLEAREAAICKLCTDYEGDTGMATAGCAITTGGDQILTHELLSRVQDPTWEPTRTF